MVSFYILTWTFLLTFICISLNILCTCFMLHFSLCIPILNYDVYLILKAYVNIYNYRRYLLRMNNMHNSIFCAFLFLGIARLQFLTVYLVSNKWPILLLPAALNCVWCIAVKLHNNKNSKISMHDQPILNSNCSIPKHWTLFTKNKTFKDFQNSINMICKSIGAQYFKVKGTVLEWNKFYN